MWQLYTTAQHRPPFYLKLETLFDDDDTKTTYVLHVTNYVKLWSEQFTKTKLLKILTDCNPGLEFTNKEKFLLTGLQLLNNPKDVNRMKFTEAGDELNISLVRTTGFVLEVQFNLPVCSPLYFFNIVTRPLLLIIDDLRKSEGALRTLLKQKDQEITLFAQECGENFSMMKCFSTPKYVDEVHMKKHSVYEDLMGSHENCVVPSEVLNGHPLLTPPYFKVKEEPLETSPVSIAMTKVKIDPNPIISTSIKSEDSGSTKESVLKTDPQSAVNVKEERTDLTCNEPPTKVDQSHQSNNDLKMSETKTLETSSEMRVSIGLVSNSCAPGDSSRLVSVNTQPRNEIGQWTKKSPAKRKKLNY